MQVPVGSLWNDKRHHRRNTFISSVGRSFSNVDWGSNRWTRWLSWSTTYRFSRSFIIHDQAVGVDVWDDHFSLTSFLCAFAERSSNHRPISIITDDQRPIDQIRLHSITLKNTLIQHKWLVLDFSDISNPTEASSLMMSEVNRSHWISSQTTRQKNFIKIRPFSIMIQFVSTLRIDRLVRY